MKKQIVDSATKFGVDRRTLAFVLGTDEELGRIFRDGNTEAAQTLLNISRDFKGEPHPYDCNTSFTEVRNGKTIAGTVSDAKSYELAIRLLGQMGKKIKPSEFLTIITTFHFSNPDKRKKVFNYFKGRLRCVGILDAEEEYSYFPSNSKIEFVEE